MQQALNGRVARIAGSWATTVNNAAVGLTTLLAALAASLLIPGRLHLPPPDIRLYAGGVLGIGFVGLTSWLARIHDVLVLSVSITAGQVLTAEAISVVPAHGYPTPTGLVSAALILLGVPLALHKPGDQHERTNRALVLQL